MRPLKFYFDLGLQEFTQFGGFVFYAIVLAVFFFTNHKEISYGLFIGLIVMYIVISVLRLINFRKRPVEMKYTNLIEKIDSGSFPSMHATRSTFLFINLIKFFSNQYLTAIFVMLVLLVCYSRMHFKKHYLSDVIVGIILGIVIYYFVTLIKL